MRETDWRQLGSGSRTWRVWNVAIAHDRPIFPSSFCFSQLWIPSKSRHSSSLIRQNALRRPPRRKTPSCSSARTRRTQLALKRPQACAGSPLVRRNGVRPEHIPRRLPNHGDHLRVVRAELGQVVLWLSWHPYRFAVRCASRREYGSWHRDHQSRAVAD